MSGSVIQHLTFFWCITSTRLFWLARLNMYCVISYALDRPSYLKIPVGPKMAHAALSRRAIDGPNVSKLT